MTNPLTRDDLARMAAEALFAQMRADYEAIEHPAQPYPRCVIVDDLNRQEQLRAAIQDLAVKAGAKP